MWQTWSVAGMMTLELTDVRVHVFSASDENYQINSLIYELSDQLVVVDAQMFVPDARTFADEIDALGKPVTRFVLSHNHPDHYLGFEVLCERFPGVPLAALPRATRYVAELGPLVVEARKAEMGELVASHAIVPDTELVPGAETIGGVRFVFEAYEDAEAESQVVIHLPDQGATAVFDLACRGEHHCFTVLPEFDHWISVLEQVRLRAGGAQHLVVGHGLPTDLGAIDATIEYVLAAGEAYAEARDHEDYAARLKARFPQRGQEKWIDLAAMLLYRVIYP
jgi:glyoxylase-like metal-dependent hydrolase (beta-lactamase superfamily II)